MSFQKLNEGLFRSTGRFLKRMGYRLWPMPVRTGEYRAGQKMLVIPNHRPFVKQVSNRIDQTAIGLLVLDGGGLCPLCSLALKTLNVSQAQVQLEEAQGIEGLADQRALVPASLASYLKWQDGAKIGRWVVKYVEDDFSDIWQEENQQPDMNVDLSAPQWFSGICCGFSLWFGQALLFLIPLAIFGLKAVLLGELALFLAAVLILGLMKTALSGIIRGLLTGCCLSVATGLLWYGAGEAREAFFKAGAFFLAGVWMGLVYQGARADQLKGHARIPPQADGGDRMLSL